MLKLTAIHALVVSVLAECGAHYSLRPSPFELNVTEKVNCAYQKMISVDLPDDPLCTLSCANNAVIKVNDAPMVKAQWNLSTWTGTTTSNENVTLGNTIYVECVEQIGRCGKYITNSGDVFATKCSVVDSAALCSEDLSRPQCVCSAGFTGLTCSLRIDYEEKFYKFLGSEAQKVREAIVIAQKNPAVFQVLYAFIMARLTTEEKMGLSWTLDDLVEAVELEWNPIDKQSLFTAHFDENLGNCFTINPENMTSTSQGISSSRFSGNTRELSIGVRVDLSNHLPWIESTALSIYIHPQGVSPTSGTMYSLKSDAYDAIMIKQSVHQSKDNCVASKSSLAQDYYEDGEYTTKGCYSACYQRNVEAQCGCMDPRHKRAVSARVCTVAQYDCVSNVSSICSDPSICGCNCPPPCKSDEYTLVVMQSTLTIDERGCANGSRKCLDGRARISFYLESTRSDVYVESYKMTFPDFLSQVGSIGGLCLGLSAPGYMELGIGFGIVCSHLWKIYRQQRY